MSKKSSGKIENDIATLLARNPGIRDALEVFSMSKSEYEKAMKALTENKTLVSSESTNGDME